MYQANTFVENVTCQMNMKPLWKMSHDTNGY